VCPHPGAPRPRSLPLVKPLTTLAAAADSDVRVPDLRGVVAIQFDGQSFIATALEGAQLVINGRKARAAHLDDGDTIQLGTTQLVFQSGERVAVPAQIRRPGSATARTLATTPSPSSRGSSRGSPASMGRSPLLDRADRGGVRRQGVRAGSNRRFAAHPQGAQFPAGERGRRRRRPLGHHRPARAADAAAVAHRGRAARRAVQRQRERGQSEAGRR